MVWKTKLRTAADLDGVGLHNLRHTLASLSVEAGSSLPMTGAMLGHRSICTTAQYAHLAEDIAILDLARLVAEVVGFTGQIVRDTSKPDGTPRKLMSAERLRALGWAPRTALEDGVRAVYAGVKLQLGAPGPR